MKFKTQLYDEIAVKRAMTRLSYEIIERSPVLTNVVLIGIKTRGVPLAKIIKGNVLLNAGVDLPLYELDITYYRDDREGEPEVIADLKKEQIEDKDVILVDDVLFTGRTTRAAIDAVLSVGRASSIKLAVLIDRGHRELPIRADFVGKNVPSSMKEKIVVHLNEIDGDTSVSIYDITD